MHKPLNWVQWISLFTALAVAVILPILVVQGRAAAKSRDQGLRTFICYFEDAALQQKQTPAQRRVAIRFFNGVLVTLHEKPCSTP